MSGSILHRHLALVLGDPKRLRYVILGGLMTLVIFLVDLVLPLGVAGGIPYIVPVYLAIWLPDRRLILWVAALCSVLIVAGVWLSPSGAEWTIVIPNRLLAIAAVWTVGILSLQRRAFDSALGQSEATNRAILEATADGILTLDTDGTILTANPALERMFGRYEEDIIGRPFFTLLDDEWATAFRKEVDRFLVDSKDAPTHTHELEGVHVNGTTFPIEVVFARITCEDDIRYTVTVRDVTTRRILEKHLLRTSAQERREIGYSIHEELGQSLTGLSLIGRQLARKLEGRKLVEAQDAAELAALLQDVDNQAMALYQSLAPLDASDSFVDALSALLAEVTDKNHVASPYDADVLHTPDDPLRAVQLFGLLKDLVRMVGDQTERNAVEAHGAHEGSVSALSIRIAGGGATASDWHELIRPLAHRAKLIDAHISICSSPDGSLTIDCQWTGSDEVVNA